MQILNQLSTFWTGRHNEPNKNVISDYCYLGYENNLCVDSDFSTNLSKMASQIELEKEIEDEMNNM